MVSQRCMPGILPGRCRTFEHIPHWLIPGAFRSVGERTGKGALALKGIAPKKREWLFSSDSFTNEFFQFFHQVGMSFFQVFAFSPKRKKLPFISFHIGKIKAFLPLYHFNIKFLCDIDDQLAGDARGDQKIKKLGLWLLCGGVHL